MIIAIMKIRLKFMITTIIKNENDHNGNDNNSNSNNDDNKDNTDKKYQKKNTNYKEMKISVLEASGL